MKLFLFIPFISILLISCKSENAADTIIAEGQMPYLVKDNNNNLQLTYGTGDSIMYAFSTDGAKTFSTPSLIGVLPNLAASHTRGPQIAATANGLLLTACNKNGDIFSFIKNGNAAWQQTGKVNDADTIAKENLMALSADGNNAFAAWLDLREKHNKIYGARSVNGGRTWLKNNLVYASSDSTVCSCCKPSVIVKGNVVYVMFRNLLNGNRDIYVIQSNDGGATFGTAQKLGSENWALSACPMDGGGIALDNNHTPQTIWTRKGKLYASQPGKKERELGEGKSGSITSVNGKNVYAWVQKGEVVVMLPQGTKKVLGKGQLPLLSTINNEHVVCIWENEKQIHKAVVGL